MKINLLHTYDKYLLTSDNESVCVSKVNAIYGKRKKNLNKDYLVINDQR
jgi:hypothetical protein